MNDVKIIRARDLRSRYQELTREYTQKGLQYTSMQICEIISKEPAPRFYLLESYARTKMYAIRNGCIQTTRQLKDLYRIYRRTGDIRAAIATPAPSYYLSPIRIYRILIDTIRL